MFPPKNAILQPPSFTTLRTIHRATLQPGTRHQYRFYSHTSSHFNKLRYPDPPSPHHSSLPSFVSYAQRTGLNEKSTVYVGTHYEYTVAQSLSRYGFILKRIGGASDNGTDLVGTWTLPRSRPPSPPLSMRVLVQCKAGSQRVGPRHVRELEGAFVGAPVGWRGAGVLGLLASELSSTKGVRDSLGRSKWPMASISCSRDGLVTQMLWNKAAQELGLYSYEVSIRFGAAQELVLMHKERYPWLFSPNRLAFSWLKSSLDNFLSKD